MSRTALVADRAVQQHNPGPDHPEQPARFEAVIDGLQRAGLLDCLWRTSAAPATDEQLALVHKPEYISLVEREVANGRTELSTGDTSINAHSAIAARLAAGSAVSAVDAVFSGSADNAFAVTRPPGHHASSDRGMGFCLFNSVAIAGRHAQKRWSAERILIVDWDVHHGNGTQDIFYHDGSVLFFSTHQSPWYPGTGAANERGEGKAEGRIINCPLPAGSGRDEVFAAFQNALLPNVDSFRPDLILISAGFDSRFADPLGRFQLRDDDFHELTTRLMALADQCCNGRIVAVLEGGYSLSGLGLASAALVRALTGQP